MKCIFFVLFLALIPFQSAQAEFRFLGISDIHYGAEESSGDGHDTDRQLLTSALQKLSKLSQDVDFILTLGDFPSHRLGYSRKKISDIKQVFHDLSQADTTAKPLFYITGNNDALGGNYQSFTWHGQSPLQLEKAWQDACLYCQGLLIDKTHLHDQGYYSSYVDPHRKEIILIALNSVLLAQRPFYLPVPANLEHDAITELQWFEQQLKQHHAQQLLIAMHIPPGQNHHNQANWNPIYLKQFLDLLNRYRSHYTEINLLTAHTHMDEIRQIRLASGENLYAYGIPSISRIHHNHPAMKVFTLDKQLKMSNYTTYYTVADQPWQPTHYQAMQGKNSIFPQCHQQTLANCLNDVDAQQICQRLQNGLFYSSKSPRVDASVCRFTYLVTSN
jgi:hypothetical protein